MVECGERKYYGFKLVSLQPSAFSLCQRNQLTFYEHFLAECSLIPPAITDPATKALLRGSKLFFSSEAVTSTGLQLLRKPPQLSSAMPSPFIQAKIFPLFCQWLALTPEAAFNTRKEALRKIPLPQDALQTINKEKQPSFPDALTHLNLPGRLAYHFSAGSSAIIGRDMLPSEEGFPDFLEAFQ